MEADLKVGAPCAFYIGYKDDSEFKTDWYVGSILKLPRIGKYADVQWANGDPKLWMEVGAELRGSHWVLLKKPLDILEEGAADDADADADADATVGSAVGSALEDFS